MRRRRNDWHESDLFRELRNLLEDSYEPGRELSIAKTKLDEAELWVTQCERKADDG